MRPDERSVRVEHELFMRTFFSMQPPARLMSQFASVIRDLYFEEGNVLFERGDPPDTVYFIVEGHVGMTDPEGLVWHFGPSSLVGIGDANLDRPRARTARAESRLHVLAIDADEYFDIMEDNFDFTLQLLLDTSAGIHDLALGLPSDEVFVPRRVHTDGHPWTAVQQLNEVQRLLVLRESELGEQAPVQPLVVLAKAAIEKRYDPGQIILDPGAVLDRLWFVGEGRVSVTHESPPIRAKFGPGAILLGLAGLGHVVSRYTARADTPVVLIGAPKEALFDLMEDHFRLARRAFGLLSHENERVRRRLADLQASSERQRAQETGPLTDRASGM
ncbi:MAG: cyclic nucleotide-binding domain-containing protein [Myxococcales bacterium]|nr:cyclic nucleotide-binding domain-containing protein [Myxococcales bacterium]